MRYLDVRQYLSALLCAIALAACGGDTGAPSGEPATRTLSQSGGGAAVTIPGVHTFAGVRAGYTITPVAAGYDIAVAASGVHAATVPRNARLRFADTSLDLGVDGVSAQAYRLYQAAFGRTPDAAGLGYWIGVLERGVPLETVAQGFTESAEYRALYGAAPDSRTIVERYYRNVLGRAGESGGMAFWIDVLERGAATRGAVLVGFSDGVENQAMVAPAIAAGIAFLEADVGYLPVAHAGVTRTAVAGAVVTLDGSLSTASAGRTLTYAWTLIGKPAASRATLVQANTVRPAFLADVQGSYTATLAVSDGTSTSALASVTVIALWQPDPAQMPASGNFVYLESDPGDYIGAGARRLYTGADSLFRTSASGALLSVGVTGDDNWNGEFRGMDALARLERGYYGGLGRFPFHNPVRGGLSWSGNGRGCNTLTGWFVIDSIEYQGGALSAVDLRFEQFCEGGAAALRGRVRWRAGEAAAAPGPVAPPVGLWQPAAGVLPASGSYVYLESEGGDYIGMGRSYTHTRANAILTMQGSATGVSVRVDGDQDWNGDFVPMQGLAQLQKGYYGGLLRAPFHNPVRGGLSWSGEGRGCNQLAGWFAVDDVAFQNGQMTSLDLRFEQRCDGASGVLRGKIRWRAGDTTEVPGPVTPPPAGLWRPAAGAVPTSGNYVYLQSMPGDYIGGGATRTFTDANAELKITATGSRLDVNIRDTSWWSGEFQAMNTLAELRPGYYGDLQRYPFHNPVKGGLSFGGDGRGCNTLTGWFVVDSVTYVQGVLQDIDLRFEQHCEGGTPALRGRVRWNAKNVAPPAGPIV